MRVLLIDADVRSLNALADIICRRLPVAIIDTANSAPSGLQKLTTTDYDVIVADAHMTDMEALSLMGAVRSHRPRTPVLILARQLDPDLVRRAALQQVFHFLPKPVEPNALMATLLHLQEQSRLVREAVRQAAEAQRHRKRTKRVIALSRLQLEAHERLLFRRQEALARGHAVEAQLTRVLDRLPQPVLICDRAWSVTVINDAAQRILLGPDRDQAPKGACLWHLYPALAGSPFQEHGARAVAQQMEVQVELALPGLAEACAVTFLPLDEGVAIMLQPTARQDRTDGAPSSAWPAAQPGAEGSTQPGFTEQLERAREAERHRIARDLHDDLGQLLTVLKLDLAWLEARLPQDQVPLILKVRLMMQMLGRMMDAMRRICTELRPLIVEDLGLAAAIRWQATTFEHRTGVRCALSMKGIDRLDAERAASVFRIFQELLTNVARHAGASLVEVSLKQDDAHLWLEVKDNGRGIEPHELSHPGSMGLCSMRERARTLGGQLTIVGVTEQGTTATLQVPLKPPSGTLSTTRES